MPHEMVACGRSTAKQRCVAQKKEDVCMSVCVCVCVCAGRRGEEKFLPVSNLRALDGKGVHHYHHQFLNREGRWGTTDDFATSFLHFSLFSTALWDLPNSRPVHSLMLSSHLFLCLPCLLPPFTVPCKMVLARLDGRETCPFHCSLRLFTLIRRSSCGPFACSILSRTSSFLV